MSLKKWLGSSDDKGVSTPSQTTAMTTNTTTAILPGTLQAPSQAQREGPTNNETTGGSATGRSASTEVSSSFSGDADDTPRTQPNSLTNNLKELSVLDPELPFGDGSQKIFGLENFGNTCYCNSILQCLYYTREFRLQLLRNPPRDASQPLERRKVMEGLKPHHIAHEQSSQQPQQQPETEKKDSKNKTSLARRTSSFFGRRKSPIEDENGEANDNNNNSSSAANGSATAQGTTTGTGTNSNTTNTVITIPNIRPKTYKVIIGQVDDPNATVEQRKRAALVKGPLINLDHSLNKSEFPDSLLTALKDMFECINENESTVGVALPLYFIETLKRENELFRSAMHQDAHEFLNFLLNEVIESLNKMLNVKNNAIHDIFQGLLTNQTKCLTCENITSRDETFLDLSLDLTDCDDLESCLKQFSEIEMLTGSNKFYCDNCHSLQEAQKKMGIQKLPKTLALHLKRFEYSEEHKRMVKLFHKITYPAYFKWESDIPPVNPKDGLKFYELYAVVVHIGGGPHHGHYVALVKTPTEGWLLFDDEIVEKIDQEFVLRFVGGNPDLATAYVLFYREIDEDKFEVLKNQPVEVDNLESKVAANVTETDGFNSNFSLDMKVAPVKSEEIESVSPLEHLNINNTTIDQVAEQTHDDLPETTNEHSTNHLDAHSNDHANERVSMNSSQHSAISSDKVKSKVLGKKLKPSQTSSLRSSPPAQSERSSSSSSSFWRRDSKADKAEKDKEKRKKRMSMSFGFGKKSSNRD